MLCVKLLSVIVVILCVMPEQSQVTGKFQLSHHLKPCPDYEKTVFTTDGANCYLFRNMCHMGRKNYERRIANEPLLALTTKAACQAKCPLNCGTEERIVCGDYAGSYVFFVNECKLMNTACFYGKAIMKVPDIECYKRGKISHSDLLNENYLQ